MSSDHDVNMIEAASPQGDISLMDIDIPSGCPSADASNRSPSSSSRRAIYNPIMAAMHHQSKSDSTDDSSSLSSSSEEDGTHHTIIRPRISEQTQT